MVVLSDSLCGPQTEHADVHADDGPGDDDARAVRRPERAREPIHPDEHDTAAGRFYFLHRACKTNQTQANPSKTKQNQAFRSSSLSRR